MIIVEWTGYGSDTAASQRRQCGVEIFDLESDHTIRARGAMSVAIRKIEAETDPTGVHHQIILIFPHNRKPEQRNPKSFRLSEVCRCKGNEGRLFKHNSSLLPR